LLGQGLEIKCCSVCVQVWVVPEVREGKIYWRADSDSALTKAGALCLAAPGAMACLLYFYASQGLLCGSSCVAVWTV